MSRRSPSAFSLPGAASSTNFSPSSDDCWIFATALAGRSTSPFTVERHQRRPVVDRARSCPRARWARRRPGRRTAAPGRARRGTPPGRCRVVAHIGAAGQAERVRAAETAAGQHQHARAERGQSLQPPAHRCRFIPGSPDRRRGRRPTRRWRCQPPPPPPPSRPPSSSCRSGDRPLPLRSSRLVGVRVAGQQPGADALRRRRQRQQVRDRRRREPRHREVSGSITRPSGARIWQTMTSGAVEPRGLSRVSRVP